MEGEQWAQIKDEFTPEEKKALWRQLGAIRHIVNCIGTMVQYAEQIAQTWPVLVLCLGSTLLRLYGHRTGYKAHLREPDVIYCSGVNCIFSLSHQSVINRRILSFLSEECR